MDKKMHKLLIRSFDEALSVDEQQALQRALENSPALQDEKTRLQRIRTAASQSQITFSPGFADNVMRKVRQSGESNGLAESFFDTLVAGFRPVLIGAVVVMIALISLNLIRSDSLSLSGAFAEPTVTLEDAYESTYAMNLE